MTIKGGIATLKGVHYEVQAVIYEIPELAVHTHGRAALLRVRALDLFERVMDLGSHRAIEALKVADR